jgi:hypothetical protein
MIDFNDYYPHGKKMRRCYGDLPPNYNDYPGPIYSTSEECIRGTFMVPDYNGFTDITPYGFEERCVEYNN